MKWRKHTEACDLPFPFFRLCVPPVCQLLLYAVVTMRHFFRLDFLSGHGAVVLIGVGVGVWILGVLVVIWGLVSAAEFRQLSRRSLKLGERIAIAVGVADVMLVAGFVLFAAREQVT